MIPLSELHPFHNHPFKVKDDAAMEETVESVKQYGVLVPAIARPLDGGGYELVAGHRRHHASELAGLMEMPVIIRELDDDAATLLMVDSNLQRETLLPSERAFAYRMKLEALKHQGERSDLTSSQVGTKLQRADEMLAVQTDTSRNQVQRFIRLTFLTPELLEMVDTKKIAFNPAVDLSYLQSNEQTQLLDAMESEQATPSLSQAQRLKKFSQDGKLTPDVMCAIMSEEKKPEQDNRRVNRPRRGDGCQYAFQRVEAEQLHRSLQRCDCADAHRTAGLPKAKSVLYHKFLDPQTFRVLSLDRSIEGVCDTKRLLVLVLPAKEIRFLLHR